MTTGEMFAPVLERLRRRRIACIVPDLRGRGRSRHLPPPYTAAQLRAGSSPICSTISAIATTDVVGYSQAERLRSSSRSITAARCRRLVLACTYASNMATLRERLEGQAAPLLIRGWACRRLRGW